MIKFVTLLIGFCSLGTVYGQAYQPADAKSAVKFTIKNFGINTSGNFKGLAGSIEFDRANPDKAVFDISIDAATVNTDNESRDSHLRKEEYFDVTRHPKMSFKSVKVSGKGDSFSISGQLTIKGTVKNISFPFTATAKDDGYLFEGSFQINRRDFNVGSGSAVLGDKVTVSLSVFAQKK